MSDVSTTAKSTHDVADFDDRDLLLGASEINSPIDFEGAIARAAAAAEIDASELVTVASPWFSLEAVGGKEYLLNKPFFIVDVSFQRDAKTQRPYVVAHIVTKEDEMFYLTDGSTGILRQLIDIVGGRREKGHPSPFEGFTIANGLRKSSYDLVKIKGETVPKPADWTGPIEGEATTYYLA